MSSGRIMTMSVDSLNTLYFQFMEAHVLPHLATAVPQIAHLMKLKKPYDVHRYLQDLFSNNNHSHYSSQANSSLNDSVGSLPTPLASPSSYQYAVTSSEDRSKNNYHQKSHAFNRSVEKKSDNRPDENHKLGMRKALTVVGFQDRSHDYKPQQEENILPIPNISQSIGKNGLMPVPSLGPAMVSDFKLQESKQRLPIQNRGKVMREHILKISKVFNDNHSKIQKYSKKLQPQKPFSLSVSARLQRKDDSTRFKDYQFQTKQDHFTRKY